MADHQEIIIENIDHLGIVAGLIDEIEIVKIINEKLGVDQREKISSGQVVKALIINALGMISGCIPVKHKHKYLKVVND
jgi:hypothetical protein